MPIKSQSGTYITGQKRTKENLMTSVILRLNGAISISLRKLDPLKKSLAYLISWNIWFLPKFYNTYCYTDFQLLQN